MKPANLRLTTFDPAVQPVRIMFRCGNCRGRYLSTVNRLRRKWLRNNPDKWRLLTAEEQTEFERYSQQEAGASRPKGATAVSAPTPDRHVSEDKQPSPAIVTPSAGPEPQTANDEIIVHGRRCVSAGRAAAILNRSIRTLERWHEKRTGPSRIYRGRQVFYDLDEVTDWHSRE
jgi:hypothetical protein